MSGPVGFLNEREQALLESVPVVEYPDAHARLFRMKIPGRDIAYEPVVFLANGRFELARYLDDATGYRFAMIIPAFDEFGDMADLAAWDVDTGAVALWRAAVSMLGEDRLRGPRLEFDGIRVFENIADWLRSGRRGVFILDSTRARWRLTDERLIVSNSAFGRKLRTLLRLPEPAVYVEQEVAAA